MKVLEEVHSVAVHLGKSENMRVSAGKIFAGIVEYVYTPGNDGAQQVIDAGHEPTQEGIWGLVTEDPSFPEQIGTSFRTGKRVLEIGRAPDPHAEEQRQNESANGARNRAESEDVTLNAIDGTECNSEEEEDWTGIVPSTEVVEPPPDPVEYLKTRTLQLTKDDTARYAYWFNSHLMSVGLPSLNRFNKPIAHAA